MSLLTDVHAYLTANGQSTALFIGRLPDTPDTAVALFQYAGRSPEAVHTRAGISRERPGLQVLVRAKAYADAETRAYLIFALLQLANATLSSMFYQQVWPMASPFLLSRDANDRTVIATNFLVSKEMS